jgi:hypothetical protein
VIGLVERGGKTRLVHIQHATKEQIRDVVVRNVDRESALHTDESNLYTRLGEEFASHRTVKHSDGEYVRYEDATMVTSNTIENVFSVFRRAFMASTSTVAKPIFTATSTNSRSATITVLALAFPTLSVPPLRLRASKASASPIGGLVKPKTLRQLCPAAGSVDTILS